MFTGFFGMPGSGKTIALLRIGLDALAEGRDVYANFSIDWRGQDPLRLGFLQRPQVGRDKFHKYTSLMDVLDVEGAVILLDEGWLYLNSYFRGQMSLDVQSKIFQSRKDGIDVYYSTVRIGQVASVVRDMTTFFYFCNYRDVSIAGHVYQKFFYQYPVDVKGSDWSRHTRLERKYDLQTKQWNDVEVPVPPKVWRMKRSVVSRYNTFLKVEDDRGDCDALQTPLYPSPSYYGTTLELFGRSFEYPRGATRLLPVVKPVVTPFLVPHFDGVKRLELHDASSSGCIAPARSAS